MSAQWARKQAEGLLQKLAMHDRAPINVRAVAERLGLPVVDDKELGPDVAGLLVSSGSRAYICVQPKDRPQRQRFTIAHEIGHHYLQHQLERGEHVLVDRGYYISQRGPRASRGLDPMEIEANAFASSLLMPEKLVRDYARQLSETRLFDSHVDSLADTFKVSEQAMTIRLTSLRLL
jgi:Zn-dependent peptidase ImmA (M78 family)